MTPPSVRPQRVLIGLAALLAAASWFASHRGLGFELRSGDAHEYAEMGRRLVRGEGFTTGVIFPAELHLGAGPDHPAVVRPPAWPLALAGIFAVTGPRAGAVHAAVGLSFVGAVVLAALLAARLAGPRAGAVAAVATATSPQLLTLALDGASETAFAAAGVFVLWLLARRAHPFAIGAACGLAYLLRYNGAVFLPVALVAVAARGRARAGLACAGGFGLVALPWWLRNQLVLGDPFYSLLNLNLWMSPEVERANGSLLFAVEPDLGSELAMHPLAKLRVNLPALLAHFPLASANLAALAGVVLACIRGERTSWAFAAVAGATTLAVALAFPYGRYFVPLLPALLALGSAGWWRHGGRARVPALALLLAAPLLPAIPREPPDMEVFRAAVPALREARRRGAEPGVVRAGAGCLAGRPLVIAQAAARVAWEADAIAIYAPADPDEFWRIVAEQPVAWAQVSRLPVLAGERFAEEFAPRPGCGPDVYERRSQR